jgi:hypothetical protein
LISDLQVNEQETVDFAGAVTETVTVDLATNAPYLVSWIRSTWTSGPAILIPGCNVRDELGNLICVIGLIPWQFAGTTVERVNIQSPEVSQTNLFGPAISGFITSGLTVFRGWQLEFNDFLGGAGVSFFGTIGFTRVTDND